MLRIAFLLALAAPACRSNAQITLRGALAGASAHNAHQLALERWNTERWQQVETVYLDPDNTFALKNAALDPGQYRLRVWGQSAQWNDFIVADSAMADSVLVFQLDYERMDGGPAVVAGSTANDLYFNLINARRRIGQPGDSASGNTLARLDAAEAELDSLCLDVAGRYRKTLVGDVAMLLYQPRRSDHAGDPAVAKMTANEFAKTFDLEKIPFHRENVLYHNAFYRRLNNYCNYFDRDATGSKACIDGIMARRNGNDRVDGFLFRYLLDKMMDFKQEDGLTYLLAWYAPDCTDEDPLPNSTLNLLEALNTCAPGKIAPDTEMPNPAGQPVDLGEVCAHNKLTIMLFWRSTCPHCKEFEPMLEKIYAKYHPLGVEVYALSTDRTEEDWREDLENHPTPWINTFIPQDRRREISRAFPAPATPTLIALDRDRRVVSRLILRSALEAYLDSELQKL